MTVTPSGPNHSGTAAEADALAASRTMSPLDAPLLWTVIEFPPVPVSRRL
jgi:hypothetical protein